MTLFYAGAPGGDLLWGIRLLVGSAMGASVVLGFTAIRRRDIPAHRAWMIRAYALGVGAGTQAFTQGIGEALFGTGDLSTAISVGSGWAINAVVAEWVIRRPSVRRAGRARGPLASARTHRWRVRDEPTSRGCVNSRGDTPRAPPGQTRLPTTNSRSRGTSTSCLVGLVRRVGPHPRGRRHHYLRGAVIDQAELYGLLAKVHDLGTTLISVKTIDAPGRTDKEAISLLPLPAEDLRIVAAGLVRMPNPRFLWLARSRLW